MERYVFWTTRQTHPDCTVFLKTSQFSLFSFEDKWFVYFESQTPFSTPTGWRRMFDIYHTSMPKSTEHWRRKRSDTVPRLGINYLKPDKVSSYVFYHYQMQEEKNNQPRDKYNIIFLDGDMIVFYGEEPCEKDELPYHNSLNTQNTPWDEWQDFMIGHFKPWEMYEGYWQNSHLEKHLEENNA